MSKIRTAGKLQEILDQEFAWRLKEIHDIRTAARQAKSTAQTALVRAGVALLYAHWEGFVKTSADAYVNFLACQGLKYSQLQLCFSALGLKTHIQQALSASQSRVAVSAIEFILTGAGSMANLPLRESIDTESNLSSKVFANIAGWLGLDTSWYEARFHLIDESLLKQRNQIAHGQFLEINHGGFETLVDEVIVLLRAFKTDLENSLAQETYKRAS